MSFCVDTKILLEEKFPNKLMLNNFFADLQPTIWQKETEILSIFRSHQCNQNLEYQNRQESKENKGHIKYKVCQKDEKSIHFLCLYLVLCHIYFQSQ